MARKKRKHSEGPSHHPAYDTSNLAPSSRNYKNVYLEYHAALQAVSHTPLQAAQVTAG